MLLCKISPILTVAADKIISILVHPETVNGVTEDISVITLVNGKTVEGKGDWGKKLADALSKGAVWTNGVCIQQRH